MKVNKLDKAHDFVMNCIKNSTVKLNDENLQNIISNAWKYADLMQEEYKKRESTGLSEESLTNKPNGMCDHFHTTLNRTECFDCGGVLKGTESSQLDWQPDWSQAPEWAKYWCMHSSNGTCYWTESQPIKKWDKFSILRNEQSPTFNYQGNWKQSLRERPETPKVEIESKKYSCNCPHWKESSFFMGDTFTCNDCGGVVMI